MKEHLVAYGGVDNELGITLKKSLKSIAESKIDPKNEYANLKQQAGFSAEVKHTARKNSENIINKSSKRVVRTDDVGEVNNQLYDHYTIENGVIVESSQMKFVGKNADEALSKLASKDFEKYLDNPNPIDVPSEMVNDIKEKAAQKAQSLRAQAQKLQEKGEMEKAAQKLEQAKKYDKIQKQTRAATLTSDEAMEARQSPLLSTTKDIGRLAHRAGKEGAKFGAAIGGGVSLITNIVAICKDEKTITEACVSVGIDTTKAAAIGYGSAAAGSVVKSLMQNASSSAIRSASKTNLPTMLVSASVEVSKTFVQYFRGEIDGVQCLEQLGEKGVGMTSSALFATAFQAAIPVPVLGAAIGGMVGYMFAQGYYRAVLDTFKEAKLAKEERIRIEAECAEAIALIKEYRAQMNALIEEYFVEHLSAFDEGFTQMQVALKVGDIDSFIGGSNAIIKQLGKEVQFTSFAEINDFMSDKETTLKI